MLKIRGRRILEDLVSRKFGGLEEVIFRKIHYFNDFFLQLASKFIKLREIIEEVICYSYYHELKNKRIFSKGFK